MAETKKEAAFGGKQAAPFGKGKKEQEEKKKPAPKSTKKK